MEFGKEIAKLRKNAGFTQVSLSTKTKVGLRLIRYIEQGGTHFRYDKLDILLKFFGYHLEIKKDMQQQSASEQLILKF
jgi:transcriptional regulator with XRE-family HTH domain